MNSELKARIEKIKEDGFQRIIASQQRSLAVLLDQLHKAQGKR